MPREATEQEKQAWTDEIKHIMERDGVSEEEANANFANLLQDEETKNALKVWKEAIDKAAEANNIDHPTIDEMGAEFLEGFRLHEVAAWTEAIQEIMARDGVSEAEANTNFDNLLSKLAYDAVVEAEKDK